MANTTESELKQTPLDALHRQRGARMVPFAGFEMPLQYKDGIIAEHNAARTEAALFDVSHMGQVSIRGSLPHAALERLVPGDLQGLGKGAMRYTQLTNEHGGILDDLMVTSVGEDYLFVVVNAGRREADLRYLRENLPGLDVQELDRALLAFQGPKAVDALSRLAHGVEKLDFMTAAPFTLEDSAVAISRSGYTGEDGFEISVPPEDVERIVHRLLAQPEVHLAGLGARDSLRLEAGLCLYGNDIDEKTTPVEAGLAWTVGKRRREERNFPGAEAILRQIEQGPARRLVGILPEGRAPARAHAEIRNTDDERIGEITSGGFGASVGGPVAMGYVATPFARPDTAVTVAIRERWVPARVAKMPFVPHRYFRNN